MIESSNVPSPKQHNDEKGHFAKTKFTTKSPPPPSSSSNVTSAVSNQKMKSKDKRNESSTNDESDEDYFKNTDISIRGLPAFQASAPMPSIQTKLNNNNKINTNKKYLMQSPKSPLHRRRPTPGQLTKTLSHGSLIVAAGSDNPKVRFSVHSVRAMHHKNKDGTSDDSSDVDSLENLATLHIPTKEGKRHTMPPRINNNNNNNNNNNYNHNYNHSQNNKNNNNNNNNNNDNVNEDNDSHLRGVSWGYVTKIDVGMVDEYEKEKNTPKSVSHGPIVG